jgi:lipopolysaccharide transport system permease protein
MSKTPQRIVIESGKQEKHYWRDLFAYKGLFYFLAWRDIKVRYKQTVLGIAWSLIKPLLTLIIFTIVFGMMANLADKVNVPYPLLVCAGILPWNFFATAFSESGSSLVVNANLMTKVYFPRLIIPASTILVSLLDFLIALALLFLLMVWYRFMPSANIIYLPLFIILLLVCSMGSGCLIAALNVKYRDFRYIIPFIVQLGLYISPVGFNADFIPAQWRFLYYLNPMTGIIEGFRWCLLDQPLHLNGVLFSAFISFLFLFAGITYFRKTERSFADVI